MKIHTFWPWLNMVLMSLMGLFFAAGGSGLGALGGGESSVAAMDGDKGAGEGGGESEGATEEGPGAEAKEGEEGQKKEGTQATEGKKLSQFAKPLSRDAAGALKSLKESNPKGWKETNNRLWSLHAQRIDSLHVNVGRHFQTRMP